MAPPQFPTVVPIMVGAAGWQESGPTDQGRDGEGDGPGENTDVKGTRLKRREDGGFIVARGHGPRVTVRRTGALGRGRQN